MTASLPFIVALALVASCARSAAAPPASSVPASPAAASAQPAVRGVLAPLAAQPLVVLPVQGLRLTVAGWSDKVGDPRAYLATVDDEIAFAVGERGVRARWAFAPDLARSARRNPSYATDPYAIALDPLTKAERDPDAIIAEPLAGQLRALAGLWDARYALVPVEMRLAPAENGGRPVIHLVLVDVRESRVTWKGDVTGDLAREFSPAIAAGIAGRVADLFITAR